MKSATLIITGVFLLAPWVALPAPRVARKVPIEVQVEVNEVDNERAASLGIDWLDSATLQEKSPAGILAIGKVERVTALRADLHFLEEEGAAELLANPNLVTDSGTGAAFHAGGEIPYITSSSLGTTNVQFKSYGVLLDVHPTLLADGRIQMGVRAGVSAPDTSAGTMVSGNAVPALLTRDVTSNVTMEPGLTMTLAGLVQTQKTETEKGVPLLRRIPFLGRLFRWRRTNFRRTTIIMFITPRVATR